MIHKSKLSLTQADACIAIAHWLNATTFRETVKVKTVEPEKSNYNGVAHFEIEIEHEPSLEVADPKETQP